MRTRRGGKQGGAALGAGDQVVFVASATGEPTGPAAGPITLVASVFEVIVLEKFAVLEAKVDQNTATIALHDAGALGVGEAVTLAVFESRRTELEASIVGNGLALEGLQGLQEAFEAAIATHTVAIAGNADTIADHAKLLVGLWSFDDAAAQDLSGLKAATADKGDALVELIAAVELTDENIGGLMTVVQNNTIRIDDLEEKKLGLCCADFEIVKTGTEENAAAIAENAATLEAFGDPSEASWGIHDVQISVLRAVIVNNNEAEVFLDAPIRFSLPLAGGVAVFSGPSSVLIPDDIAPVL